tara:strand:+ start:190707 stop:191120 length:414 start_codon:yes stop_codon:yes gene_type:complete
MNLYDVAQLVREFLEKDKFPKTCGSCGKVYYSLTQYFDETEHVGKPCSLEADHGHPLQNLGKTYTLSNCTCGSTLCLTSKGMPGGKFIRFMGWSVKESIVRGVALSDVFLEIREEMERQLEENRKPTQVDQEQAVNS